MKQIQHNGIETAFSTFILLKLSPRYSTAPLEPSRGIKAKLDAAELEFTLISDIVNTSPGLDSFSPSNTPVKGVEEEKG